MTSVGFPADALDIRPPTTDQGYCTRSGSSINIVESTSSGLISSNLLYE